MRRQTVAGPSLVLAGFVAGALVAGLVVPFALGESDGSPQAVGAGAAADVLGETNTGSEPGQSAAEASRTGGSGESSPSGSSAASTGQTEAVGGPAAPIGSQPGGPAATQPGAARSEQTGVTATEILVGAPILNFVVTAASAGTNLNELTSFDQEEAWQVFIDEANRSPVHGRKLKATYDTYDPLSDADMRRECTVMTEDRKVFAVLGTAWPSNVTECITVEHNTVLVNIEGHPEEQYTKSEGRLVSTGISQERMLRVQAKELHRLGHLKGKTIGVLTTTGGNDNVPVEQVLIPAVKQLGYTIAHVTTLAADLGVAQSQMPVEVAQMRRKGVDALLLGANPLYFSRFAQEAERQGLRPLYLPSDFRLGMVETISASYPDSFGGAIGLTTRRYGEHRVGAPEPRVDARCAATYTRGTGKRLERGSSNYALMVRMCTIVLDVLVPALENAGPALTNVTFAGGVQQIGPFESAFAGPAALGPGKFDAPESIRSARFHSDCKCWKPIDDFRPLPA